MSSLPRQKIWQKLCQFIRLTGLKPTSSYSNANNGTDGCGMRRNIREVSACACRSCGGRWDCMCSGRLCASHSYVGHHYHLQTAAGRPHSSTRRAQASCSTEAGRVGRSVAFPVPKQSILSNVLVESSNARWGEEGPKYPLAACRSLDQE